MESKLAIKGAEFVKVETELKNLHSKCADLKRSKAACLRAPGSSADDTPKKHTLTKGFKWHEYPKVSHVCQFVLLISICWFVLHVAQHHSHLCVHF